VVTPIKPKRVQSQKRKRRRRRGKHDLRQWWIKKKKEKTLDLRSSTRFLLIPIFLLKKRESRVFLRMMN
jgi:hypothetical protein